MAADDGAAGPAAAPAAGVVSIRDDGPGRPPFGVSVRDFGASGSPRETAGTIAAGSTRLRLAAPIDLANGQGIAIAGAGASGARLVTAVVSGGGTRTLVLASPAAAAVRDAAVLHDDTEAIRTMLRYLVGRGGGVGYFPNGQYNCAGPYRAVSTGGAILSIPQVDYADPGVSIVLQGEGALGNYVESRGRVSSRGVVVDFLTPPAGNDRYGLSGFGNASRSSNRSAVDLQIRDMAFRTPFAASGPAITALDLRLTANVSLENVTVDTSAGTDLAAVPSDPDQYGLMLPDIDNNGEVLLRDVYVAGYHNGIQHSEHAVFEQVFVQDCVHAIAVSNGLHNVEYVRLLVQECLTVFDGQNGADPAPPLHGLVDIEYATEGPFAMTALVSGSTTLRGELRYTAIRQGVGPGDLSGFPDTSPGLRFVDLDGGRSLAPPALIPACRPPGSAGSPCAAPASRSGSSTGRN